ncbi:large ribosomal subunit protein mL45 [Phlebotomus argentipes]|uniref:large ribosomal subunit protein mL45 n=1 Tax=Phlebotomus argentipes TaxID=94469 RepID=UPI002892B6BB|nr:large ribosomal subunit protein mL45 [Phlebotomus argentipes]
MSGLLMNGVRKSLKLSQGSTAAVLGTLPGSFLEQKRFHKHWNPAFKWWRARKVIKIKIPNLNEKMSDLSTEELKSRLRERGLQPPRPWMERPFYISCTGGIFEPYVPPEGDGKLSSITKKGAKQKIELLEKKSKSMLALRKIRTYEEDFDPPTFAKEAEDIYIKVHELMMQKKKYDIRELITERAYPEVMHNIQDKTIHWKFLKTLDLPKVVHARCTDLVTKENVFAQVTVRFHTQQLLAIYDRFGRLLHGSEILAKDVLEYVVFERHMANEYGKWRLHEKIVPEWVPAKEPGPITYRIDDTPPKALQASQEETTDAVQVAESEKGEKQVATA